jgi:hypothetical protein
MPSYSPLITEYPLRKATTAQLWKLCAVLWSWKPCDSCETGSPCEMADCTSKRFKRLGHFFGQYELLTASYDVDLEPDQLPCLRSHEDLFAIIQALKLDPDISRAQLAHQFFGNRENTPSAADQMGAINLAVKVFVMVNCSAQGQSYSLLENGPNQIPWRNNVRFSEFIQDIFPLIDHPSLNEDDLESALNIRSRLTATKLKQQADLTFLPTNDLRRHLVLNSRNGTVEIFHYTAFLKEHLRLTKDKPEMSITESLQT